MILPDGDKNWTSENQQQAIFEGWCLDGDEGYILIATYGDRFATDVLAWEHVQANAEAGSPLHIKAMQIDVNTREAELASRGNDNWKYNAGYQYAAGYHD